MVTSDEPPRRFVHFAGRRWWVKRASQRVGPGPNRFDDGRGSVDVDRHGNLVLRVRRHDGHWVCAEVVGEEPTGYGTYEWTVAHDLCGLDRQVVVGVFTWSDDPAHHHREIDIEAAAWGRDGAPAGQFVVQPSSSTGHQQAFPLPPVAPWRCSFDWAPSAVTFRATGVVPWTFSGDGVPIPGGTHPRINLWLYEGVDPHLAAPVTVTIESFRFTPRGA